MYVSQAVWSFWCRMLLIPCLCRAPLFFFFTDPTTTEIYTLSLHDALPIYIVAESSREPPLRKPGPAGTDDFNSFVRSEEHTSELQSHHDLVCRLLLEKKKNISSVTTRLKTESNAVTPMPHRSESKEIQTFL